MTILLMIGVLWYVTNEWNLFYFLPTQTYNHTLYIVSHCVYANPNDHSQGLKYLKLSFSNNHVNNNSKGEERRVPSMNMKKGDGPASHINSKGYLRHSGMDTFIGGMDSCNTEATLISQYAEGTEIVNSYFNSSFLNQAFQSFKEVKTTWYCPITQFSLLGDRTIAWTTKVQLGPSQRQT